MQFLRSAAFWNSRITGVLVLGAVTLGFFGSVLFGGAGEILSEPGADIWKQFAGWRHFGFDQIRQGNFPLWTPFVFSGMPYFSGFQSALLYPPNWTHLALPLPAAINWGVAFHFWWLGCGVLFWMRFLGLRQVPALYCAGAAMFCAPHFLHLSAGHLSNLAVMAWVPWLFFAVDRWRREAALRWVATGGAIVGMQILAGHVQYVYYGAIAASLHAILTLFLQKGGRMKFLGGFAAMYLLAALVAAAQLLPGLEAATETLRGATGQNAKAFAGTYSFPPENMLTLIAPRFFGDNSALAYWGRWSFAEMNAFFGITGLWCAIVGIVTARRDDLRPLCFLAGSVVCFVLAFGAYTPLFDVFLTLLPGYDAFRGSSKFIFFAALFGIGLAGVGLNRLLDEEELPRQKALLATGLLLAAFCAGAGLWIGVSAQNAGGFWASWHESLSKSPDIVRDPGRMDLSLFVSPEFLGESARAARNALWIAAAIFVALLLCLLLRKRLRLAVYGIAVIGLWEVFSFASPSMATFELAALTPIYQQSLRAEYPGDYRVRDFHREHGGMLSGLPDIWGEDPGMPARYARFVAATQQVDPDHVSQNLEVKKFHPLLQLLRLRFVIAPAESGGITHEEFPGEPMRRFEFMREYEVLPSQQEMFARLFAPGFDPRKRVLLEEAPGVAISSSADAGDELGAWKIEKENTDELFVTVTVPAPCILLMTDPYSSGWRVESASDNQSQQEYRILPADYCLRAIPLEKGGHHLRIYYLPRTLKPGIAISVLGVLICFGGVVSKRKF